MKVIVTGAAQGIGRAIALKIAKDYQGAKLLLTDLNQVSLDVVANEVSELGCRAYVKAGDLTDPIFIEGLSAEISNLGGLDAVASNAGIALHSPLLNLSLEMWEKNFALHVRAPWLLAKACHAALKASQGAFIITASVSGTHPTPPGGAYSSSKAAALMLAKQMARELGVHGIRVNVVAPGIVKAGMAGELLKTDPVYAKRAGKVVPLGEFQTANQVADVVGFLCSTAGDYITGTVLLADGGCSLFQFDSDINAK